MDVEAGIRDVRLPQIAGAGRVAVNQRIKLSVHLVESRSGEHKNLSFISIKMRVFKWVTMSKMVSPSTVFCRYAIARSIVHSIIQGSLEGSLDGGII